jgi:membrane-bound lytic murein transglycosylase D
MARFRLLAILISIFTVVSHAQAQNPTLDLPGLEQRVDFWKKIYTQYGKDDRVIHDGYYVNLIYGTATGSEAKAKMADVKTALREIRDTLDSPETRTTLAQEIAAKITAHGLPLSEVSLDTLAANLHSQQGVKERFRDGVIRSGRYVEEFRKIVKDAGVPEELALLPLVESSFENVRSSAGAAGMWQFMKGTGRQYLKINGKVDERLDPVKAATAAARLLRDNYNALGEWPLAVTAYNHGRAGMMKAKARHGSDLTKIISEYTGPVFGYASMNFYSEFLAAVEVWKSYPQYFGELVLDQPRTAPSAPATTNPPVLLASTTKAAAAKAKVTTAAAAKAAADKYKVKRGDTLSVVAQRFGTSIRSLMEANNLKESVIYAGQILLVK